MITEIEDFFAHGCGRCARFDTADCSALIWAGGLSRLRAICRGAGLTEVVKWGHPCYMHGDRNIALIGALRGDFRLNFFDAALLNDAAGLLERQGPNTRHPDSIRFTSAARVTEIAPEIRDMLTQAIGNAAAGLRPARDKIELDLPDELVDALDADPDLAEAFAALTPGRQRSYVIALSSAKTSATRTARVERFRARIMAGKGATER